MPNITSDEIVTQKHKRSFIQFGGAIPTASVMYGGQDGQYMTIDGLAMPESGGIDPIWVHDPNRVGVYKLVGRSITAPDLANATLIMHERHGSIPRQLGRIGCQFNLYESTGGCQDLSDFLSGWSDYVLIYSGALVTDKDMGTRSSWDGDDAIEDQLSIVLSDVYPIGALSFGEGASTQVDREVMGIAFQSTVSCGDCSPATDGASRIYAVTKSSGAGSPGYPAELIYTLDGGQTWNQANITGIGASEDPTGIDVAGRYVVISAGTTAAPAYYYAQISGTTGVPGTISKVTTGFVANYPPADIYVAGPREVYFCGTGGYIYKSTNIPGGVTVLNAGVATSNNLTRIHGNGDTLVAVGASGTIIKSLNRGKTWSTTTAAPCAGAGCTIQAVQVMDKLRYWVGTNQGRFYYTLDGGDSWTELTFPGSGVGQVYDIAFPTQEVGYVAYTESGPTAKILTTWNGGKDWTKLDPRIQNMPTFVKPGRLATPHTGNDAGMDANNLAVAGLAGNGTDGIILIGAASRL